MSETLNSHFFLWLLAVWQPVSSSELTTLINQHFQSLFDETNEDEIDGLIRLYLEEGLIIRVHRQPHLYALTQKGNDRLPPRIRWERDRIRMHLLKDVKVHNMEMSGTSGVDGLGGVAPSVDVRFGLQRSETSIFASFVPSNQRCWSRFIKQFIETGQSADFPDTLNPSYVSFFEPVQNLNHILG